MTHFHREMHNFKLRLKIEEGNQEITVIKSY
jgi:hypothetical protein